MNRLVGWHTRIGELGLRLALLQALWLVHALAGGVILGVFPATAAVVAVLRRDQMVADGWAEAGERQGLWREFHAAWRSELVGANVVGYLGAAAWALVLLDHRVVRSVDVVGVPALLVWLLTAFVAAVTGLAVVLRAHFEEGPLAVLRRACVLTVARPLLAVQIVVALAGEACLYYVLPGLAVVFGVSAPAAAIVNLVWRTGLLPRPSGPLTPVAAP
jgi:uncharacterized membrane protein YesL